MSAWRPSGTGVPSGELIRIGLTSGVIDFVLRAPQHPTALPHFNSPSASSAVAAAGPSPTEGDAGESSG